VTGPRSSSTSACGASSSRSRTASAWDVSAQDEKNQDSTELTGDINYRKIAEFGSDSDPRAFNFDGEFNIANRGIIEFIEVLKLDVAFLYDLLGGRRSTRSSREVRADRHRRGHPRPHERGRVQEAPLERVHGGAPRPHGQDRHPYITKVSEEQRIYGKDYNAGKIRGKHIAPHTLETAAMWAVLTRLEDPKKHQLTLVQKMKLYDGKTLPGFTQDNIKELRKEANREGMDGISPRYIQDKCRRCRRS